MKVLESHNNRFDKLNKNHPVLIYLKVGKMLEAFGIDNCKMFTTNFFLLLDNYKDSNCIRLKLLAPKPFCDHCFLKPTDTTIVIQKDCIMGIQIAALDVATDLVLHHPFEECIKGEFSIGKGYTETVIWQSNIERSFTGQAEMVYTDAKEDVVDVLVSDSYDRIKSYKLYKGVPLKFDFSRAVKITVARQDSSAKMSGNFLFDFIAKIKQKIEL